MADGNIGRRRYLALSVSAIGIAGCLGSSSNFEYPPGFSENGIDVNAAFGFGSPMDDLDSVQSDYSHQITNPDVDTTNESSIELNREDNRFLRTVNAPFETEIDGVDEYFTDPALYQRVRYADGQREFVHSQRNDLSFRSLMHLDTIPRLVQDVSFGAPEIDEDAEPSRAIYTADTEGIEGNSRIQERIDTDGSLINGGMTLIVDEEGRLHTLELTAAFSDASGIWNIGYDRFNDVTVVEPDWLDQAQEAA